MKLETGDILLVDTEGVIASSIDVFQGNDYNHALMVVKLLGVTYFFEAIKSGVALTSLDSYDGKDADFLLLKPKKKFNISERKLAAFILPLTKANYGFCNLFIYQAIRYITKWLGCELWIGRSKEKSTKKFICGKLVAYVYNHFTGLFPDWHIVAPADLYNSEEFNHIEL